MPLYDAGWLFCVWHLMCVSMFQAVCVTLAPVCRCLRSSILHTLSFFNFYVVMLAGFVCHLLFFFIHFVCVTLTAVWWCLRAASLHKISILNVMCMKFAGCFCFFFIVFIMIQAVCVPLATVWATSLHKVLFLQFMLCGWLAASVCH